MKQSFEEFYQGKTDKELYRIFNGRITTSYDDRILAQKILQERGFDFENVGKYKDKWELEKLLNDIEEERNSWWQLGPLIFSSSYTLLTGIALIVGAIVMLFTVLPGEGALAEDPRYNLIVSILLFLIMLIAGIAFIQYAFKRKKEIKYRKQRIDDLTRKILNTE